MGWIMFIHHFSTAAEGQGMFESAARDWPEWEDGLELEVFKHILSPALSEKVSNFLPKIGQK